MTVYSANLERDLKGKNKNRPVQKPPHPERKG